MGAAKGGGRDEVLRHPHGAEIAAYSGRIGAGTVGGDDGFQMVEHRLTQLVERSVAAA